MSSKFTWNQQKLNEIRQNVMKGLMALGFDTANQAQEGAPVRTGALVNSIRTTTDNKDTVYVLAGGKAGRFNVPYARKREYHNNLHPNKRFYMTNAAKWAKDNYLKYFKGVTK